MAAADADTVDILMRLPIWAAREEPIIGDVPDVAAVVGPAPAIFLACRGAALHHPIAVLAPADGIKLVQVELLGVVRAVPIDFFPYPFGVQLWGVFEGFFNLIKARGGLDLSHQLLVSHKGYFFFFNPIIKGKMCFVNIPRTDLPLIRYGDRQIKKNIRFYFQNRNRKRQRKNAVNLKRKRKTPISRRLYKI